MRTATTSEHGASARITMLAAAIALSTILLDTTVVNVALVSIGHEFGAGVSSLQWVVDGYLIAYASLLLSGGALSDRLGASRCLMLGVALFIATSAICGFAPSIAVLILGRVLQGASAALIMSATYALVRQAYGDPRARIHAVAMVMGWSNLAMALGPAVGGLLTGTIGWRGVFFINLPLGLVVAMLLTRSVRPPPKRTPVDAGGQLLALVAIGGVAIALMHGSHAGFADPLALAAFAIGLLGALAFWLVERRREDQLVPFGVLRSRSLSSLLATNCTLSFSLFGVLFALGIFFEDGFGLSVIATGLMFLPLTLMMSIGVTLSGRLISRWGSRRPALAGIAIAVIGCLLLTRVHPGDSLVVVALLLVPLGTGLSLMGAPLMLGLLDATPADLAGVLSGTFAAIRQLGSAAGVAVFGALLVRGPVAGTHSALYVCAALLGGAWVLTFVWMRPSHPGAGRRIEVPAPPAPVPASAPHPSSAPSGGR